MQLAGISTAKSKSAKLIAKRFGKDFLNTMKSILINYLRQPSTWLGLAKLGAAIGLYSTGMGGAIGSAVVAVFGAVDVIRNETLK